MSICGVKYRMYPTAEQAKILSQWIGCSRSIYNHKVHEDRSNYKNYLETGKKTSINQSYAQFKTDDKPWLKEVPSQILRNSAVIWYQAKQRFFKKLANNPTIKNKHGKKSVLLTNELFSIQETNTKQGGISKSLQIGTKRFPVGNIKVVFHRPCGNPKQIVISKKQKCWFVSFCYETNDTVLSNEELISIYSELDEEELNKITVGIDRGISIPFQVSNETNYDFSKKVYKKIKDKEKKLKRYQRRMARQKRDSKSRSHTQDEISRIHTKISNIRHDFCHQTSHQLASSAAQIFSVEKLSLKNMTRKPKPKKSSNGNYLPNNAKAKAGLNRELLAKGLSKTIDLLEYKARKLGKCVVHVSSFHSSQECSNCGYTHPDNRKTQAIFSCLSCGIKLNADLNASLVLQKRGVRFLLSEQELKIKTRRGISQSKAGRGICKTTKVLFTSVADSNEPRSSLL